MSLAKRSIKFGIAALLLYSAIRIGNNHFKKYKDEKFKPAVECVTKETKFYIRKAEEYIRNINPKEEDNLENKIESLKSCTPNYNTD